MPFVLTATAEHHRISQYPTEVPPSLSALHDSLAIKPASLHRYSAQSDHQKFTIDWRLLYNGFKIMIVRRRKHPQDFLSQ